MKAKRLWWTIRLYTLRGTRKRAEYSKKHKIYAGMGENVALQPRTVPLYSELIRYHNNIIVAKNVDFCTHDVIHNVVNRSVGNVDLKERIGCIEIMDNVFIGSNSVIMYGTRIGPNVIVASGSVVTKDCEPDSVYAGCPARKIGTYADFIEKRKAGEESGEISTTVHNQALTRKEIESAWRVFEEKHK